MGKYKRYKNRIEMFLSSERGKRILNFIYSFGAAIVIIGTLFKLLHLPYANQILFVAMITEACVFFISGFERPGNEYNWEEVFPVLKSRNPLDRPDFVSGGAVGDSVMTGSAGNISGGTVILGDLSGMTAGTGAGGGTVILGNLSGMTAGTSTEAVTDGAGVSSVQHGQPSPQERVNAGMATMGLNISEEDSEALAESIRKLNNAAEQIAKMADLTEATQTYIDRISAVSQNLEQFGRITGSLGEVSDSLIHSCKVISGSTEEGAEKKAIGYAEHISRLNDNVSEMNHFYEAQLSGLRTQIDTIRHINAGLNRIRDMYDSSLVDSAAFRNENERMAQLLLQLNQVYSRLLQAMTVNVPGGYPPPPVGQQGYPQPPYPGGHQSQQGGNYR